MRTEGYESRKTTNPNSTFNRWLWYKEMKEVKTSNDYMRDIIRMKENGIEMNNQLGLNGSDELSSSNNNNRLYIC